ncbi:MAG: family 20 glycosylhydrolase [Clostridia bacterium]|nr:family 20 glycosylhydrolase [Clostridia bacterium]
MKKGLSKSVFAFLLVFALLVSMLAFTPIGGQAGDIPEWQAGQSYSLGALATYKSVVYKCTMAHMAQVGWEPDLAYALWEKQQVINTPVTTNTPTTTSTPIPTPTTFETVGYSVKGYINSDFAYTESVSKKIRSGFKIEVVEKGLSVLSNENGYFEFKVPKGTYTIKISKDNYLTRNISNVAVIGNTQLGSTGQWIDVWAGDMLIAGSQDNAINMNDIVEVINYFNTSLGDGKYKADADLNKDDAINMTDILIIINHFNKAAADYPAFTPIFTETPTPTPTTKPTDSPTPTPPDLPVPSPAAIIPKPVSYQLGRGYFTLTNSASIYVQGNSAVETDEINQIGQYLANKLKPSTRYSLNVVKSNTPAEGSIYLTTIGGASSMGNEGYTLEITLSGVKLTAYKPEGLFRGIQTIRQSLPAEIEKSTVVAGKQWLLPCSTINDNPTYPWRGAMLDVARHFFGVNDVKRCIDLMAQYKMNRFHMHLSDDQGWRIEIKSWPDLAKIGGSTQVGGGAGGYYTQEQFIDLVNYAKERYITLVPEIDMPGHTNAALASYGQLNPDGQKKPLYTGMEVGFSTLMCRSEVTYTFVDDVVRELSGMTAGEYIHIGGDESHSTPKADYDYFVGRVKTIVNKYGKKMVGWDPVDTASGVGSESILQNWLGIKGAVSAKSKGMKIIFSPSEKAYIDMKYNYSTPIGLTWAGYNPTDDAYQWDPTNYVPQNLVLGVECPLWTETITKMADIEFMTYPRLPGHAEIGWTPLSMRNWDEYKLRLKEHGPRMSNQGINFYRDTVVPW